MRHLTTTLHIVAALTLTTVTTFAQDPTPPPAPNEVPLDGFSALLLAAGAGYGAYRVKEKRKVK
jgi:heme A synthase